MNDVLDLSSIVIARQPIFDRQYQTYAYELLFRNNSEDNAANFDQFDGDLATTKVINYSFLEFGIDNLIGNHLAFVNLTRNFILNGDPLPFAGDRVVLEVLEDIEVDDELITAVRKLAHHGYHIALDDFIFHESLRPLLEVASIVKVDILSLSEAALREHVEILKTYPVKLLAEKVETKAEFELCFELGFEYFQGYFFCRPNIVEGKAIPENKLLLLELISKLQHEDIQFYEIENIISHDPGLSFKLLRLLNSAAIGFPREITSLKEGLVILGINSIKKWTMLIALSEMNSGPTELLHVTLVRAKMAEKLAHHFNCSSQTGFLIGLFSTIDVLLSKPMQEIISPMPLMNEIKLALISHGGIKGQLLTNVTDYCEGRWRDIAENPTLEEMSESFVEATKWAKITLGSI